MITRNPNHSEIEFTEVIGWMMNNIQGDTYRSQQNITKKKQKCIPMPGIEPGPPGWKPGILTTRPHRNLKNLK